MAIMTLNSSGVSTNTDEENLGSITNGESRSFIVYNETGSAVVVEMAGNADVSFDITYPNGEVIEDLSLNGDTFSLGRGQAAVLLGSNGGSGAHDFQIAIGGVTTTHGTSASDGGRIIANSVTDSA